MMDEQSRPDAPGRSRRLRTGLVVSALLAIVLLATACSGGSAGAGVAGSASAPNASASPSGTLRDAQLDYARCMRDHGIADFPDPAPGGGTIRIKPGTGGPGSDLDPSNPRFKSAGDACSSLLPAEPSQDQPSQKAWATMLRYARCMREHGFPTFPDPEPGEGFNIDPSEFAELDPSNPRFQAANEACRGPSETSRQKEFLSGAEA
jgi:hypothetical protein